MGKEIMLSNIGFLLGVIGIIISVIPFLISANIHPYSIFLPCLFGIMGFVIVFKIKNKLNDDIVKAGLIANPLAIVLAIVQLIIYLIK